MQKYCRTGPWSAFRSKEIFFSLLAQKFFWAEIQTWLFSHIIFLLYFTVSWKLVSPLVYFSLLSFLSQITNSCSSLLPKISWQTGAAKGGSHCISCQRHLQWFQQQSAAIGPPNPYVPCPSKPGTLVCHFTLAAARGWVLPGPGAKPSLAPHGCSWLSTTGQGHFSRGIWKGPWLAEAGPALKGSVCSFH